MGTYAATFALVGGTFAVVDCLVEDFRGVEKKFSADHLLISYFYCEWDCAIAPWMHFLRAHKLLHTRMQQDPSTAFELLLVQTNGRQMLTRESGF